MLSARLKAATQDLHKVAEERNFVRQITEGRLEPQQYQAILQRNYWLHAGVEAQCRKVDLAQRMPALVLPQREKAALAEQDLMELETAVGPPPRQAFPNLDAMQTLGALYVAEGSTLGGQFIRRAIERSPALAEVRSFRLLECYGEHTGRYWRSFMQVLNGRTSEADYPAVTAGACAAFDYFNNLPEHI